MVDLIVVFDIEGWCFYNNLVYWMIFGDLEGLWGMMFFDDIYFGDCECMWRIFYEMVWIGIG